MATTPTAAAPGGALPLALESARRVLARHPDDPAWMQLFVRLAYAFEEIAPPPNPLDQRALFAQSHPEALVYLLAGWLSRAPQPLPHGLPEALHALQDALQTTLSPALPTTAAAAEASAVAPAVPAFQAVSGGGGGEEEDEDEEEAFLSTVEVAERLGVTRQAVNQRRAKGRLVALARGREFVYPAWQLDPVMGVVSPVVEEALRLLGDVSLETKARFFGEPSPELGGARPVDVLRAGRGEAVVVAAARASERRSG